MIFDDDDDECPIFDDDIDIYSFTNIYIYRTKFVRTQSVGMTVVSIHLPIPLRHVPISIYIYNY